MAILLLNFSANDAVILALMLALRVMNCHLVEVAWAAFYGVLKLPHG